MNNIRRASFACLLAGTLCGSGVWAAATNAAAAAPSGPFDQLVDDFVFGALARCKRRYTRRPASATTCIRGVSLDDLLDDYSPAAIAASREFARGIEARIAKLDTPSLDKEQRADIDMIRDAVGASRLELDEIQSYRHNPTTYVELLGNGLHTRPTCCTTRRHRNATGTSSLRTDQDSGADPSGRGECAGLARGLEQRWRGMRIRATSGLIDTARCARSVRPSCAWR